MQADFAAVWRAMEQHGQDTVVRAHVQPGAKRAGLVGTYGDALKVAVQAPAVGGRANEALLRLLASELELPVAALGLLSGATSRRKRVLVRGLGAKDIVARLCEPNGGADQA